MRFFAFLLLCVGAIGAAFAQETPDLKADAQLQASLSFTEPLIPLRELVQKVRERTGAPLAVAPEIADDKVCVLVSEKPAHEILNRLAELLRYQWQWGTDGKTYVLRIPAVERQRERALYQLAQSTVQQRQREALQRIIALARQYSLQQLTQMLGSPDFHGKSDRETSHAVVELSNAGAYCVARTLGLLPDAIRERLWTAQSLIFSSELDEEAGLPLQPDLERALLRLFQENDLIDRENTRLKRVEIRYLPCSQSIDLSYIAVSSQAIQQHGGFGLSLFSWGATESTELESHALCKVWREWQTNRDELRRLPEAKRAENTPALQIPEPLRDSVFSNLITWAQSRRLNLYADVYRIRPAQSPRRSRARTEPIAQQNEDPIPPFEWSASAFWLRLDGDTLLARHKDYYWLRPSEIPERLLRPLEAKIERREPITLDEWANFVAALTPMQLERASGALRLTHLSGSRIVHATSVPMGMVLHTMPALQFWASLTPAQRAAVQRGDPLLLERLTPTQRQRFAEAFNPPPLPGCVSQESTIVSMTSRDGAIVLNIPEYWFSGSVRRLSEAHARPDRFQLRISGVAPPYTANEGRPLTVRVGASPFNEPSDATDKGYRLSFIADGRERAYVVYQTVPETAGSEVEIPRTRSGDGAALVAPNLTIRQDD
ncbi:MAG: hypothetical protein N2554_10075 [Fimbriimonadales bacterium]|nr:hypothetical protein [Fimbriimonadales bacterium]